MQVVKQLGRLIIIMCSIFVVLSLLAAFASAQVSKIVPGTEWLDTDNNQINAHGAGILIDPHDQSYWWYGENAKTDDITLHGVNLYHSDDLLNWKFIGEVFNQANVTSATEPVTIERPKVLYDAHVQQYVMWMHIDPNSYALRQVAVAVAPHPSGPWSFVRAFQPDDLPSLDMTVFVDEDETTGEFLGAYFIRSVDNSYVGISQLSNDLMDTTGLISIIPTPREGHAMFKSDGYYYMLTSHLTGWSSNPMEAWVSNKPSLHGAEWISLGNPTGSSTTFESQSCFALHYVDAAQKLDYFIMMNDRWDYPHLLNASYIWLPIVLNTTSKTMSIPWQTSWQLTQPFQQMLGHSKTASE